MTMRNHSLDVRRRAKPDRGCVVLDQPQSFGQLKVLRLVCDTAAILSVVPLLCVLAWVPIQAATQAGSTPYRASATGAGNSHSPVFSADGRHVAFVSHANNLVTNDDLGPHLDLFVRDLVTSNTVLVSVSASGVGGANDNVVLYTLSSNAQSIAFETAASNLAPGDTNRLAKIFVRDLVAGTTRLVSVNAAGAGSGNGPSSNPLISEDGRYVIFESLASNLVTNDFNGTNDIFIRDLTTGITELVSVNAKGTASPDGPSHSPSISANGLFVAFASRATNLVVGVTNLLDEIYVRDIAGNSNLWAQAAHLSGTHSRSPASGALEPYRASEPLLSADGRYVAFKTLGQTVRFDLHRPTNSVTLAFTNQSTFPPHLATHRFDDNPRLAASAAETPLAFGADGRYLAYTTKSNLLPNAGIILADFESLATNWVFNPPPGGTSGGYSYYSTNVVPLAQIILTNIVSGPYATWTQLPWLSIGGNASRLLFLADGTNLVFSPTNRPVQLYGLDLPNGPTRLISVNRNGLPGSDLGGVVPAMTPDGSLVAWDSPDDNIVADDLNRAWDVFVRNLDTGDTQLFSVRHLGMPASSGTALSRLDLNAAAVSADGRRIAFVSLDNTLTRGDTNLIRDVFVHDLSSGSTFNVSDFPLSQIPYNPVNLAAGPTINADGRYLAFAGEDSYPSRTNRTLYWRDLSTATNRIVAIRDSNDPTGVSLPVLSSSGRLLAFDSAGIHDSNFDDGNGQSDVFVRLMTPNPSPFLDCSPNPLEYPPAFVSSAWSANTTANGASINPAFSPDSGWILFQSTASNLLEQPVSAQSRHQLYARSVWITNHLGDNCGGLLDSLAYSPVRLVSYSTTASSQPGGRSTEIPLPGGGTNPRFSADSRFVAFESVPNVIYRHDLEAGYATTVVTIDGVVRTNRARLTNAVVCVDCANPTLNSDGRFIAYESRPASGQPANVFVKDLQTGLDELISISLDGTNANGLSSSPLVSFDARYVVFASKASDLVANDTNQATDIFARDRLAGVTHCLSRNWLGTATGNRVSSNPVMSADGRTVAFQSFASDLIPGDYNDTRDVFVVTLAGPDADGDGLDDDWEMAYFSTASRDGSGDFDNDGASDLAEFRAGTNPANDASILRVLAVSTVHDSPYALRQATLVWSAVPGRTYRVQFKDNVTATTWMDVPGDVVAATTSASKTYTPGYYTGYFTNHRFYRVLLVQ